MKNGITRQIMAGYGDLRKSEKKAADYILDHLEEAAGASIDRLAKAADVSQPTVLRTLRALGFRGYKDFKYRLVSELALEADVTGDERQTEPLYGYTLRKETALEEIPAHVTETASRMLGETLKNISVKTYRKAVDALRTARTINIYSVENSGVTAQDLLAKLLYLGLPCRYFSDYYYQQISAGNLSAGDVAVGISYSGESRDTVDVMRTAKKAGATTIAITNFKDSPISRYSDILICTSQEQFIYGNAIFSRMPQLLIVDMLYMGIIASDYGRYVKILDRGEKMVRERAYPAGPETKPGAAKHFDPGKKSGLTERSGPEEKKG